MKILKLPKLTIDLVVGLKHLEKGRDTASYLRRLNIPHKDAVALTKAIKKTLNPIKALKRKTNLPDTIGASGWKKITVPDSQNLAKYCAELFEKKKEKIMADFKPPYGFVLNVIEENGKVLLEDPEDFKPIVEFCSKPEIYDAVAGYIGEKPVISNISLLYTMPDSTRIGPQLFHRDTNEYKQIHIVIPVWEVDDESGPFTFIPADESAKIVKALKHENGRIPDETIFQYYDEKNLLTCTGKPGDVYLLNPCQCIHFGARTKSKPRLLLIINMTSIFEGVEGQFAMYRAANRNIFQDDNKVCQSLLNVA